MEMITWSVQAIKKKCEIKLSDINYSFKDKDIFKNLNMKISTNSFISIFGKSGAGKKYLVKHYSRSL